MTELSVGLCCPTLAQKARKDGAPYVRAELTARKATAGPSTPLHFVQGRSG